MTHRERVRAVLHDQAYDRMPLVHFGFWDETYRKFAQEGHITESLDENGQPDGFSEREVAEQLGFDFGWNPTTGGNNGLRPGFEHKIIETFPDGSRHELNGDGVIVKTKPGAISIPAEIGHTLVDRESWEKEYLPRLQFSEDRYPKYSPERLKQFAESEFPIGVACGSLYGNFRNYAGVVGTCYLLADDEDLFKEIIDTIAELCYKTTEAILAQGVRPDFGHFWEDICFKNGPLVNPDVFEEFCGPHYHRITDLFARYGCDIVSLDCDGCIDALIPTWLNHGVNTMFPIEVGTWEASIAPWRKQYGKALRGVGGMDKRVFAQDYAAVDREIERLRALTELGGYIPCPDHRIPPDAKWENIQYYCDRFRKVFG
ncbi:MAG: hypothetical protein IKU55_05510 [Clostridia bacterium]|nr:hypothetical protein [Clostridia bacterium]